MADWVPQWRRARTEPVDRSDQAVLLTKRIRWIVGAEAMLLALVAITIAVLGFQEQILKREMAIDPADTEIAARYFYSDEQVSGSSAVLADQKQALAGSCRLGDGFEYPFCGFGLLLNVAQPKDGFDLSGAEEISLDLTYEGSAKLLGFTLKHNDKVYNHVGEGEVDKPNQIEVPVRVGRQSLTLDPKEFRVASWWLEQKNLPPGLTRAELSNVTAVEVQTGAGAPLGTHRIRIHGITVTIRVMTLFQLYSALAFLWVVATARFMLERRRREERRQRELAERRHKMLDAIPQMVWSANENGHEYYNRQWLEFTGVQIDAQGTSRRDLIHPDDRDRAAERWKQSLESGVPYECEYRLLHRSGEYRWVLSRGLPELQTGENMTTWYGTCTDINDRVLNARALDESERLTRGIVSAIPDCVALLDDDGRRVFVNQATADAYGASQPDELLGEYWLDRFPDDLRLEAQRELEKARRGEVGRVTALANDCTWWDTIIAPVCDQAGKVFRILILARDVSAQKAIENQAKWTAAHDALTKLPNRTLFQERIERLTETSMRKQDAFALVLLDVDNFKRINDSAGHDAGDAILCAFAERLLAVVRLGDTVARLSGDEFALLLPGVKTESELRIVLERLASELRIPCAHAGRVFDCSASIGAGIFGKHGSTGIELQKNVDVALYAAKAAGKGNYQVFRPALRQEMQKRSSMLSLARKAVSEARILPYYQPKYDLRTGSIVGFEALLRWRAARGGMQTPGRIAAAFEDLTLAAEISDQMVDNVIQDLTMWSARGFKVGEVAINASAAEFRRGDFADRLLDRLRKADLPVRAIQLEVTETVFLGRGAECVERALKTLSAEGMKIALDDFGTGYASLSHLSQFPVDILKIDRSFVSQIRDMDAPAPILDAVINLGKSLGITVVAEGIETELQHHRLRAAGCDQGQGYLYSPAISAKRVPNLLISSSEKTLAA